MADVAPVQRGPEAIRAIAFDLDGTLIDTAPDIDAALNSALHSAGLPGVRLAETRTWIGDGPQRLIERALAHLQVAPTDTLRADLRAAFDAHTLAEPMRLGRVFEGIAPLLARWHGVRPMAVVTNKPTVLSRRVLEAAGLLPYFGAVCGADTLQQRKPAPTLLVEAAALLRVPIGSLLMVGDSVNDLRSAQAAGCPAAWVAWGYGAWPDQDAAPGTLKVHTPHALHLHFG
jgi:phosphoglycolate phosphatase